MKAEMRKEGGSFVHPKGLVVIKDGAGNNVAELKDVEQLKKISKCRAEQRSCKRPRRRSGPATCILAGFLFLDETGDLGGCPGLSGRESLIDGTA